MGIFYLFDFYVFFELKILLLVVVALLSIFTASGFANGLDKGKVLAQVKPIDVPFRPAREWLGRWFC